MCPCKYLLNPGHTESHGCIGGIAECTQAALCHFLLHERNRVSNRIAFQKLVLYAVPEYLGKRVGLLRVDELFHKTQVHR